MALIVQKYGGTSVGSIECIEAVAKKISEFRDKGDDVVVVVSAMSGETNRLTALAMEMMEQPTPREMDVLLSTGRLLLLCFVWPLKSVAMERDRSLVVKSVYLLTKPTLKPASEK